jgi:hypothetical protein
MMLDAHLYKHASTRMHKTTRRTTMRLSISMPDNLHKQVLIATAKQQLKSLKAVTASDFIRAAIEEKLNLLTSYDDAKGNSITDAPAPVTKSTIANGTQAKKRRRSKITPELHALFISMQSDGATASQIADALDCSVATIGKLRKKLKESNPTSM